MATTIEPLVGRSDAGWLATPNRRGSLDLVTGQLLKDQPRESERRDEAARSNGRNGVEHLVDPACGGIRHGTRRRPQVDCGPVVQYPGCPGDASGPLMRTKGLMALPPLTADAQHADDAAAIANRDARETWAGLNIVEPWRDTSP
jgi:hypothetical protein